MKRRYWGLIAIGGVVVLAVAIEVLNYAYYEFNQALRTHRVNAVINNDPFLSLLLPCTVIALVGMMMILAGTIGFTETYLRD